MKTPAVKYAVYALVFTIVWTIIEHFLSYNTTNHEVGQYTRNVSAWVFYALTIVAIFQTRKQQGSLTFAQGLKAGSILALIYSIGVVVIYGIYGEVINKQFKPTLMAFERAKLETAHATPGVMDAKMNMIDMTTGGSLISYCFLFLFMFLGGFVISIIASLAFKRQVKTA